MSQIDLVTGGAGFIGSHLCRALVARGRRVRVIDNLSTGSLDNVEDLIRDAGNRFDFVRGDLLTDSLPLCLEGVSTVYHQAAMVSVQQSMEDPLSCHDVNVNGSARLFEMARAAGVRRLVYASSSAVYGEGAALPNQETLPLRPVSPYAASKCVAELYARVYSSGLGLPMVGLRYFNVFGPRQDPGSEYAAVIPRFISRMLRGQPPIVYGDGGQSRDFIYVDNVVEANLAAASAEAAGVVVNVATGVRLTLNELVGRLNDILGTCLEARYEPARAGEIRHSVADIEAAEQQIGFVPRVSLDEGLRSTVEWFRQQGG